MANPSLPGKSSDTKGLIPASNIPPPEPNVKAERNNIKDVVDQPIENAPTATSVSPKLKTFRLSILSDAIPAGNETRAKPICTALIIAPISKGDSCNSGEILGREGPRIEREMEYTVKSKTEVNIPKRDELRIDISTLFIPLLSAKYISS